jgi:hypothetical protein
MKDAIFLSASVPDPRRSPEYAATADAVAITAAVSALTYVVLGRRPLVWGGHPAITPMIAIVAQALDIEYEGWVRLYQSRFFDDEFPEDNAKFANVTYVDAVANDRDSSLRAMRTQMFSENTFAAAVFVGGMASVVEEYDLFHALQPSATLLPVASTGGATAVVAEKVGSIPSDLQDDLDYVALFHRRLGISVREERYKHPALQPTDIERRYWRPERRKA